MTIKTELLELQQQADDGLLQVETVVDWAERNTDSALHKSLEWDDAAAGHEWRCQQVRRLIAIHVVNEEGIRQMVSLTIDRPNPGGGYRDLADVAAAPKLRRVLLQDALDELERVQARYDTLTELSAVWREADRVRQRHKPKEVRRPHSAA